MRDAGLRQLHIGAGDMLAFTFSNIAIKRGDSVNFVRNDDVVLHIKIRSEESELVINSFIGGVWGKEEKIPVATDDGNSNVSIEVFIHGNGIRISAAAEPVLRIEDRFAILGDISLFIQPSISMRHAGRLDLEAEDPASPRQAPGVDGPETASEIGYIDSFSYIPSFGGIILFGWVRAPWDDVHRSVVTAVFEDGEVAGIPLTAWHKRSDLGDIGTGYVMFVPGAMPGADGAPVLHRLRLAPAQGGPLHIVPSPGVGPSTELQAVQMLRDTLQRAFSGDTAELQALLKRPIYLGVDTLTPLGLPIHVEVDEVIEVRPGAAFLFGWMLDTQDLVTSVHLCCCASSSRPLADARLALERNDIVEAYAKQYGITDSRAGFIAFADTGSAKRGPFFLEVRLATGKIVFKPLPPPSRAGVAAIRRVLGATLIPADEVQRVFDTFGPPILDLNRRRLARPMEVSVATFGTPPASPRCSLVIPLYGRLDFLRYQLALFSAGGLEQDEILYVLDEPARKGLLLDMAHSAHASFQVPFRIILPAENRGFGPASNLGMQHAQGRYVCFLNSDVFPERTDFFDTLVRALEADPGLGVVGGLLLFADSSVQHASMDYEALPQFGDWLFPTHPGKGRLLPAGTAGLIPSPAITGACMLLARDLAMELGGFDPDYVIGDFEDADLCDRIVRRGLRCAVDSRARAYHLERQSQGDSANAWRHNVTLLNAWTFNRRLGAARDAGRVLAREPGR
ncbi:glycosyltransferase [Paeniroseomonas aquatica]|uniref:Glycosyltransferase n=2 Tax=Paeniroseomonas aquatica TaxID=373043 RepID=A0ABT8A012_9PROT|nr:glycosyltransferase [Paeniroseomonas aquatica]